MMGFHASAEEVSESNIFTIKVPIVGMKGGTPFLDVEQAAMRQLGPLLRAFADEVEKTVEKALDDSDGNA
jgi:hypothetical protein